MKKTKDKRHNYVYKLVSPEDEIVYIGVSKEPGLRFQSHVGAGRVSSEHRIEIFDTFTSRKAAQKEELRLIKKHCPVLNKTGIVSTKKIAGEWDRALAKEMIDGGAEARDVALACGVDVSTIYINFRSASMHSRNTKES